MKLHQLASGQSFSVESNVETGFNSQLGSLEQDTKISDPNIVSLIHFLQTLYVKP